MSPSPFGLRSASGESGAEGGEKRLSESQPERNARRRAADGSSPPCGTKQMLARDERAV